MNREDTAKHLVRLTYSTRDCVGDRPRLRLADTVMSAAPHLAHQTWAHAREGGKSPPMITYSDLQPYQFEIGQDVRIDKPDSPFDGLVGQVTNRRGGKPNKYTVRIESIKAPVPIFPFTEKELQAFHFLPVPLFTPRDRVMVFGRAMNASDPAAMRLLGRQLEHQKRQIARRCKTAACIEMPRWTRSTSREAVSALIKRSVRQDYIKHIQKRLAERQIARAA